MSRGGRPAAVRVNHTSHWGAFHGVLEEGRLRVRPHPDDPHPSPLLGNMAAAVDHPARVARPMVRRGWLEDGPGPSDRRGRDAFVAMGWDEVLDRLAGELARVRSRHGAGAIYGGSYGWASAGRFHHAQSQLKRFLNLAGGFVSSVNTYSYGAAAVLYLVMTTASQVLFQRGERWARRGTQRA